MTTLVEESRKVSAATDGLTVTRVFQCRPYAAFPSVLNSLLGGVAVVGGRLVRTLPARDPYLPLCLCQEATVEGVGAFGSGAIASVPVTLATANGYDGYAQITATYKTINGQQQQQQDQSQGPNNTDQNEMDLADLSWDTSAQQLTLPNKYYDLQFSPTRTLAVAGVNATRTLPRLSLTVNRHMVINNPTSATLQLAGRINRTAFTFGGQYFPAETLRYESSHVSQKITNQQVKFYEVSHKFEVQGTYDVYATGAEVVNAYDGAVRTPATTATGYVGWNRIFVPDRGYWDRPQLVSDNTRGIFLYDDGITQTLGGRSVAGFRLLFHPAAY